MTIFDGTKQDILDAVASGHVSEQDARDEFAVRHAEGKEGYEEYAPTDTPTPASGLGEIGPEPAPPIPGAETSVPDGSEHDAPEVEYTGGDAEPTA